MEGQEPGERDAKKLITQFKRKGAFDELRRKLYKEFTESVSGWSIR
jgi:hypothetical protein